MQQSNHLEKHRENRLLLGVRSAWEKGWSDLPQAVLETHLPAPPQPASRREPSSTGPDRTHCDLGSVKHDSSAGN